MDILCSDKTGTLTVGVITVAKHVNVRGEDDETVIRLAALNSAHQTGLRSPMDEAILRHEHPAVEQSGRVDEIPFDFARWRVSVVVDDGGRRLLVSRGAPEGVLDQCVLMGTSSNFGNMVSMAAASLFLPFLPMLPLQILLNNFLYDLSQVAIPSDRVDTAYMVKPRRWNVGFIRRYMLVLGPISSGFDVLTFLVMLRVFHAGETLFHTGWFMESLATQTLVIFVIRTAARPWASRPSPALARRVGASVGVGLLLPFTPLAPWLGFVPPPPLFLAVLIGMVVAYLGLVELVKRRLDGRGVA
jgi:magnesium-transporting ATPase (P-type)